MYYTKSEADAIFRKEAILIGSYDRVPMSRVSELLSEEAAAFARRLKNGYNGFGIGDYTLYGLDIEGFRNAVSYANVVMYKEMAEDF